MERRKGGKKERRGGEALKRVCVCVPSFSRFRNRGYFISFGVHEVLES